MISLFHRAKHWQLFTFLVGGVALFQILAFAYMTNMFAESIHMNQPPKMSGFFLFFIPMVLLVVVVNFGWEWSVGAGLRDKLPPGVNMNFKLYKAFTLVAVLYPLLHVTFLLLFFSSMENVFMSANPFEIVRAMFSMVLGMIVMIPLALFAMFCMFYNFYFCAKTLKSIELGREAELGDYIGYFFLFWFNFVGFWIIQPSINQITSEGWTPPPTPPDYNPVHHDPTFDPIPQKEYVPPGELLKTKDHEAFEHDDDFDGLF